MKVADLSGKDLDYWVAKAAGCQPLDHGGHWYVGLDRMEAYAPSSAWKQGGPIIEREHIATMPIVVDGKKYWRAVIAGYFEGVDGLTVLEAAMRAFVASKYGNAVTGEPK